MSRSVLKARKTRSTWAGALQEETTSPLPRSRRDGTGSISSSRPSRQRRRGILSEWLHAAVMFFS